MTEEQLCDISDELLAHVGGSWGRSSRSKLPRSITLMKNTDPIEIKPMPF